MVSCLVKKCSNHSGRKSQKKVSFYSVPKIIENQCSKTKAVSSKRRSAWLNAIERPDLLKYSGRYMSRICSEHFITGAPAALMDVNNPDWIPTQKLVHVKPVSKTKLLSSVERHERAVQRSRRKIILESRGSCLSNFSAKTVETALVDLSKSDDKCSQMQMTINCNNDLENTNDAPSTSLDDFSESNYQDDELIREIEILNALENMDLPVIQDDYSAENFDYSSEVARKFNENNQAMPKADFSLSAKKPSVREMWTQIDINFANSGTQTITAIDDNIFKEKLLPVKVNSSCQTDMSFFK